MKHLFTLLIATVFSFSLNAQSNKEESCLEPYQKAFAERGAYPVEDGTYKNVIIVINSPKEGLNCFSGKAKVEGNYVVAMYLSYEDNTYEFLDRKYKGDNRAKINNGISENVITENGEKICVIFPEKIKPKKKQFKKVTGPDKNF